jgi:hypothetical protein
MPMLEEISHDFIVTPTARQLNWLNERSALNSASYGRCICHAKRDRQSLLTSHATVCRGPLPHIQNSAAKIRSLSARRIGSDGFKPLTAVRRPSASE